jgi:hypothetical protein
MAQRIAELATGGASLGVAATAAKVGAVAVVAGGAITGPAVLEDRDAGARPVEREVRPAARAEARALTAPVPAAALKVRSPGGGGDVGGPDGGGDVGAPGGDGGVGAPDRGGGKARAPRSGREPRRKESSGGSARPVEQRSAPAPERDGTPPEETEHSVSQGGDQDETASDVAPRGRPDERGRPGNPDENRAERRDRGEDQGANEDGDAQGGGAQDTVAEPPPAAGAPQQPLAAPAPPDAQGDTDEDQQGEVERLDGPSSDDQGEDESD